MESPGLKQSEIRELPWSEALSTLAQWIPDFPATLQPQHLGFDCIAGIMASVPGGFQSMGGVDHDGAFIDSALEQCARRPSEVIVIPDCGMIARRPILLPVTELRRFTDTYQQPDSGMGLLDGTSDIFFGFNTGDMLLVDHDERVWFTEAITEAVSDVRESGSAISTM